MRKLTLTIMLTISFFVSRAQWSERLIPVCDSLGVCNYYITKEDLKNKFGKAYLIKAYTEFFLEVGYFVMVEGNGYVLYFYEPEP